MISTHNNYIIYETLLQELSFSKNLKPKENEYQYLY